MKFRHKGEGWVWKGKVDSHKLLNMWKTESQHPTAI